MTDFKVQCLLFKTDSIVTDYHRNCFWSPYQQPCNHEVVASILNGICFFETTGRLGGRLLLFVYNKISKK